MTEHAGAITRAGRPARCGVAVLRLRGVLSEASACRLAASLRWAFAADPDLLITDVGGLRGWDDSG